MFNVFGDVWYITYLKTLFLYLIILIPTFFLTAIVDKHMYKKRRNQRENKKNIYR